MSYKISYVEMSKRSKKDKRSRWLLPAALAAVALAIGMRFFYPDATKLLTEALFPLTSASSQAALEVLSQNIKAGDSFSDAVTAFCQEIIYEADIS